LRVSLLLFGTNLLLQPQNLPLLLFLAFSIFLGQRAFIYSRITRMLTKRTFDIDSWVRAHLKITLRTYALLATIASIKTGWIVHEADWAFLQSLVFGVVWRMKWCQTPSDYEPPY